MSDIAILRRPQVEIKTGLSKSAIYSGMQDGSFPRPIRLGPRTVGWIDVEIDEWVQAKIDDRMVQNSKI